MRQPDPKKVTHLLDLMAIPGGWDYSKYGYKTWHRRLDELWTKAPEAERAAAIHVAFARMGALRDTLVDLLVEARDPKSRWRGRFAELVEVQIKSDEEGWSERITSEAGSPEMYFPLSEILPPKYWDRVRLRKRPSSVSH